MSLSAINAYSGVKGFFSLPGPDVPEVLVGSANFLVSSPSQDDYAPTNDGTPTEATRLHGVAQRQFSGFLKEKDKNGLYCGLSLVTFNGSYCWTTEKHRKLIDEVAEMEQRILPEVMRCI